jgi:hypothetical protein
MNRGRLIALPGAAFKTAKGYAVHDQNGVLRGYAVSVTAAAKLLDVRSLRGRKANSTST